MSNSSGITLRIPRAAQVGALFVLAAFCLYVGLQYLKGSRVFGSSWLMHATYDNVAGLMTGSAVYLQGYQVGQVQTVTYLPQTRRIEVTFTIDRNLDLPRDTEAAIITWDLLGMKVMELRPGNATERLEDGQQMVSTLEKGMVEEIGQAAPKMIEQINTVLASVDGVVKGLDTLALNQTLRGAAATAQRLPNTLAEVNGLVRELRGTNQQLGKVLASAGPKLDTLLDGGAVAVDTLTQVAANLNASLSQTTANLNTLLADLQAGKGTAGLLLKDPALYYRLDSLTQSLDRLATDLQANPGRYVHFSLFGRRN